MSGKGKKREERENTSDDDISIRKKFPKKDSDDDDPDVIVACEISKNRRVTVKNWQGKVIIDIREVYVKDGKKMPGRKGITLNMDQWKVLRNHLDEIDQAFKENS